MKILAVDDDETILELLGLAIQVFGDYEVVCASSGFDALKKIGEATQPFDCFLLDIQMPNMTGIDLCGSIRTNHRYVETPIIMLTAMSEKRYIDAAFSAGATDFIVKPFDMLELKSRIHLAEKQSLHSHKPATAPKTIQSLANNLVEENLYKITDPIPMVDVDHALRPDVFSNYLEQLHRLQYLRTKVFAIQVQDISTIYSYSTGLEFRDHMTDITEEIVGHIADAQGLICYLGNGLFCCIIDAQFSERLQDLPVDLDASIYNLGMVYRNGAHVDVQFEIGAAVSPSIFSKLSAADIMHRALNELNGSTPSLPMTRNGTAG